MKHGRNTAPVYKGPGWLIAIWCDHGKITNIFKVFIYNQFSPEKICVKIKIKTEFFSEAKIFWSQFRMQWAYGTRNSRPSIIRRPTHIPIHGDHNSHVIFSKGHLIGS